VRSEYSKSIALSPFVLRRTLAENAPDVNGHSGRSGTHDAARVVDPAQSFRIADAVDLTASAGLLDGRESTLEEQRL
jgi:hypothetical protein